MTVRFLFQLGRHKGISQNFKILTYYDLVIFNIRGRSGDKHRAKGILFQISCTQQDSRIPITYNIMHNIHHIKDFKKVKLIFTIFSPTFPSILLTSRSGPSWCR